MRAMYRRKTEKEIRCPLEYGLELFGGKWKSRIICVLAQKKTLRYGELRAELANITDAVLSAALKELLDGGMALRRSYDEIPPRVEYSLTDKGRSAVPILQSICRWSAEYHDGGGAGVPRLSRKFRTERKSVKSVFSAARLSRELARPGVLPRAAVCP